MRALLFACLVACSSSTPPADDAGQDAPATDAPAMDVASEAATDTWASYANGFFQTYCDGCHMAGSSLQPSMPSSLYFTSQANVEAEKSVIRCGVCVTQDAT